MFPIIKHIDDVLPYLKGKDEFIISEKDHFDVINYVVQKSDTFDHDDEIGRRILLECRGLKFDKSGNILSRPYSKFFNVNEKESTNHNKIDWNKPHVILEKLDGSMIHPVYIGIHDAFRLCTKMGITDTAMNAEVFLFAHDNYIEFMREMHQLNLTPIFEWISPKDQIVVQYDKEDLIITGIRDIHSGIYKSMPETYEIGKRFNIPVVKSHGEINDILLFLEQVRHLKNEEGYVIRFDDGLMIKMKAEEYVTRHKSKDILSSEKDMASLIIENKSDDFVSFLMDEDKKKFEKFQHKFNSMLDRVSYKIIEETKRALNTYDRKEYALKGFKDLNHDSLMKGAVFKMWDTGPSFENAYSYIQGMTLKHTSTITKFEEFKRMVKL